MADPTTSDEDDFDATEASLESLRSTSEGAQLLETITAKTKTVAQEVWTVASPVLEAAGEAAIPIITQFALAALKSELVSLAGGKIP